MPAPVQWGAGVKETFTTYVVTDLQRTLMDRSTLEKKWATWLDQYRAPTTTEIKNFPWEGASNRTLPFTAMNADPLVARFMTTLHTPENLWTLRPMNERWSNAAKPMQDYLQYLSLEVLKMFDVNYRAILELIKLGTCIYKTGWTFERSRSHAYLPDGSVVPSETVVSRPFVDHVALEDFVLPAEAYHIQPDQQGGAAWVAERFFLRQAEFLARAQGQQPFLPDYEPEAVELVKNFASDHRSDAGMVPQTKWDLDQNVPSHLRRIELFEVHCRYDTTGTGTVDDIVAVVHLPSRTLLRAVAQPYRHGQRPYHVARYLRGDGFYGIGECEQCEVFQEMLTQLWNYQMDNVLAVNAPMLGVKLGANVVANEPIYPLKIWALDDPSKDIREVKLSEVYPSLTQFAGIIQSWGERRTGLNDLNTSGNPASLPSRTPATSLLSMLQEGNRRFDLSLKDLRDCLSEIGRVTLQNLQQFLTNPVQNPQAQTQLRLMIEALGQPEGPAAAQQLLMPMEDISAGLGVSVSATSGSTNKEVEKQSFLALLQLQSQMFAPLYLQLAQVLGNPQLQLMAPVVVQTAAQLFVGTSELQKRLYEQFDIRNTEDVVVNAAVLLDTAQRTSPVTQALTVAAAAAASQSARGEPGPDGRPANPAPDPGMALLFGAGGSPLGNGR